MGVFKLYIQKLYTDISTLNNMHIYGYNDDIVWLLIEAFCNLSQKYESCTLSLETKLYTYFQLLCICSTTKILKWDVTTIDKLMYILLPLLLFKSAFILMFIMSPLDPPTLTMHCWPPAEFSGAWVKYVNSECLRKSKSGQIYPPMGDTIPDHNELPGVRLKLSLVLCIQADISSILIHAISPVLTIQYSDDHYRYINYCVVVIQK